MRLRPARATRKINSQAWARYSVRKPKKNYIKARPHTSLNVFKTGTIKPNYTLTAKLTTNQNFNLRSNSLEAARIAANWLLEHEIPNNYYLRVITYPHNVLREKRMATGAGADRISQGMTLAFGRPTAVAARVFTGQPIFEVKSFTENREVVRQALKRASSKLSGTYKIVFTETPQQAVQGEAA